ncbi:DUF58 domain-containing protein [Sediminibacillus albus]|uniref:Uncharacterized conserved protein, DUF58 family, contains vWF domain n=1 Tax=Sediminibacillus albus TaxID=407036 RepID=A0A1G8WE87_9BACI|nr:DUF58 domain-containing protein [Sediminibacillus albus]SDJ76446.1 Uncharacterized conserved protein, DUF58 family, contains vWF domain [Sediminibacillus albus]
MKLEKRIGDQLNYGYELMVILVILIFVFSIIFNRPLLFILVGIIMAYLAISIIYERNIGNKLALENPRQSIRLFPGEISKVTIAFTNPSAFPIVNGRLNFSSGNEIEGMKSEKSSNSKTAGYEIPFSIIRRGRTTVSFPFAAQNRGVTRLSNFKYTFPHLTGFDSIYLNFLGMYRTEFIVYPEPLKVQGVESLFVQSTGSQRALLSPYEDTLNPAGTRDYVSSDPFSRIHWKASARTSTLQTKIYERTLDFSWVLVINLAESSPLGNAYFSGDMEKIISQVTYFCQIAARKGYPYELYINLQRSGKRRFFSLEEGNSTGQLKEALELLARINTGYRLISFSDLLHYVDNRLYKSKSVVFFGEADADSSWFAERWSTNGLPVYQVKETDGSSYMKKWGERI